MLRCVFPQESVNLACASNQLLLLLCLCLQLSKAERYRDLLAISVVHTLNAALCEFHTKNCPPSDQLREECGRVTSQYKQVKEAVRQLDVELSCVDELVRGVAGKVLMGCVC
jgi:hypothetical protein